jgi:competence protein ComEC
MIARLPFVGFVVFYAAGILVGQAVTGLFLLDLYHIVAVNLLFAVTCFFLYRSQNQSVLAIGISVFFVVSGALCTLLQNQKLAGEVDGFKGIPYSLYTGIVKTIPEKRKKTFRFELAVTQVKTGSRWIQVNTRAMVNIPSDAPTIPRAGDFVMVKGELERPGPAMNPEEFDYRKYLWNKGIVWTAYLPAMSYQIAGSNKLTWSPGLWSVRVSEWADRQFRESIRDDRSYGLVKAMLLGRRDDLRSDQIDDYTTSGTVHILSVSGMHVMLIFLVISMLFGWMKRLRGGRYLYLATVVLLLIFYSIVTGFPPSVQRATIMCIVLVVAEVFHKKHSSVNSLGVSAFIILLLDPLALYDVGFQLSYLAMLGIFLFYKPLESLWYPSNWLLLKAWQVTALSFAAQLATFPISIYYFHQFPFYFWLVNPFVILFTNGLLPAAMLLLVISFIPIAILQTGISWLVELLASAANFSAAIPKYLPGYLIDNLYLDRFEAALLFGILLMAWLAYEYRDFAWVKLMSAGVAFFVFYACSSGLQTYLTPRATIHAVPKHAVVSYREGDKMYISCDTAFLTDSNAYNFHLKNYAVREGVRETIFLTNQNARNMKSLYYCTAVGGSLMHLKGQTIYMGEGIQSRLALDYQLIVSARYPRDSVFETPGSPVFLLGGNVKARATERWQEIFSKNRHAFHDLYTDGALSLP